MRYLLLIILYLHDLHTTFDWLETLPVKKEDSEITWKSVRSEFYLDDKSSGEYLNGLLKKL